MQLPIVNALSGTDPNDLLCDYGQAHSALMRAADELSGVWPHGRDYQGGDINAAMREHADRCLRLKQIIAEIDTIRESLV